MISLIKSYKDIRVGDYVYTAPRKSKFPVIREVGKNYFEYQWANHRTGRIFEESIKDVMLIRKISESRVEILMGRNMLDQLSSVSSRLTIP